MGLDIAKIEDRIDRTASAAIVVSDELGGVRFTNMVEVMEFAKMLAISKEAVPQHMRGEPGICLAVCVQALEWRFSPFAVANKSYVVNGRLAYESQLVHAVIEQRAPIKGRLRHRHEGEGDERICIVWATPKNEAEPLEYTSPPIGKISPKNSPLWKTKPDYQLYLNASRDWCRMYYPDILLGVFAKDDMEDAGELRDITPNKSDVGSRLKGGKKAGFEAKQIEQTISETAGDAKAGQPETVSETKTEPEAETEVEETAKARGLRLLPLCATERDVADLRATISDELPEEQQASWAIACDARQGEVRKTATKKK